MSEYVCFIKPEKFNEKYYIEIDKYIEEASMLSEEKAKNKKLSDKLEMLRTRCFEGVEKDFDKGNYDKLRIMGNVDDTYEKQKKRIEELEAELSVKEDLLKTGDAKRVYRTVFGTAFYCTCPFCGERFVVGCREDNLWEDEESDVPCEDDLPFSAQKYEEDLIVELEEQHQNDCIKINQLSTTIDTLVDKLGRLRKQMELV